MNKYTAKRSCMAVPSNVYLLVQKSELSSFSALCNFLFLQDDTFLEEAFWARVLGQNYHAASN